MEPAPISSRKVITKFEEAAILGMRMEQLRRSAPTFLENSQLKDVRQIAIQEYNEGRLPFCIGRRMPNGKEEIISLSDLKKKMICT